MAEAKIQAKPGLLRPSVVRSVPDGGPIHAIPRPASVARPARPKVRHWGLLASFVVMVLVPAVISGWYLFDRAAPQYASYVGFSVRSEESSSAIDVLGGLTEIGGGQTRDADILYEFLTSPRIVDAARSDLNLQSIWYAPGDPVFSLGGDRTLEALTTHWGRKVAVDFDPNSGLLQVRALAFSPEGALALTTLIERESATLVDLLTQEARVDAIAFAQEDLTRAEMRLTQARRRLAEFRTQNQMVDPQADLQAQMGVLGSLQASLAEALIELDLMEGDPRAGQFRTEAGQKRVDSIRAQIIAERARLADGSETQGSMTQITSDFEELALEVEFAQGAYVSALANHENARAEAARRTRYLASFVSPTRAERADYPQRFVLFSVIAGACALIWAILSLTYYGIRDRR